MGRAGKHRIAGGRQRRSAAHRPTDIAAWRWGGGEIYVKSILRTSNLSEMKLAGELTEAFIKVTTMKPAVHTGKNMAVMNQIGG